MQKIVNYNLKIDFIAKLLLTVPAVVLILFFLLPVLNVDQAYANFQSGKENTNLGSEASSWEKTESSQPEVKGLIDVSLQKEFQLIIPKIGVDKKVISNVNPGRIAVYGPIIEQYVAHGKFTKLPDEATQEGNVYLFAHREGSAGGRDIGFFRRLGELNNGDKAYVKYAGKTYVYEYVKKFVIEPDDTWVYTPESNYPALTLQTCENGADQRLIVRFKLVKVK